ncbi:MAG: hypothetical protein WC782_00020 [Methylococcaceae bacterium]|jgi:hypothetical protein
MFENYFSLITAALAVTIYIAGVRIFLYKWRWEVTVAKTEDLVGSLDANKCVDGEKRREDDIKKLSDQIENLDSLLFWGISATIIAIIRGFLLSLGVQFLSGLLAMLTLAILLIILLTFFKLHLKIKALSFPQLIKQQFSEIKCLLRKPCKDD